MTFGERLTLARKQRKMSQEALALKSGVSQSAISAIEKDINSPSANTISMLAVALGCPVADLLSDDEGVVLDYPRVYSHMISTMLESLTEDEQHKLMDYMQF